MFGSIQKENLSHRIIAAIKDHILKEKLKPGDRLATEREMAEAFDVSRSSVREAVKILEAIGVLESRPKHGISVRGFDPQAFFKYLSFGRPANRENILEMLDLRQVVDLGIADMVVERATEEDLAVMSKHIEGMRVSLKAPVEFYTHDWALHFAIYEATKNPSVQALGGVLIEFFVTAHREWWNWDREIELPHFHNHEQIYLAIKNRDADGVRDGIRGHLKTSLEKRMKRDDMSKTTNDGQTKKT